MKHIIIIITGLLIVHSAAFSQSEDILSYALEGNRVEVLIEMPATSEGIDLRVFEARPIDMAEYSDRIKNHGIAIYPGDVVMITKVRVKSKHIEFQLAGGGYGTWGDESASVNSSSIPKSAREKELEELIRNNKKTESSVKESQKELDQLRDQRNREQLALNRQAALEAEMKKDRIEEKKLQAGSRFNLRFKHKLKSRDLTIENIKMALEGYINFEPTSNSDIKDALHSEDIQKGLTIQQLIAVYGIPQSLTTKEECGLKITECFFEKGYQIVKAILVEDVLVKYTIESK